MPDIFRGTKPIVLNILMFLCMTIALAQDFQPLSIHAEEQARFKTDPWPEPSGHGLNVINNSRTNPSHGIFGYHPYWMNNSWGQYQWNLLTDLCYFSYEVNSATGFPSTLNEFETAAVIDSALANGVKVHLCVTLFSGHNSFMGNPAAWINLNQSLSDLVLTRGIRGINIDFEAVPSSQSENLTAYMRSLRQHLDTAAPGTQLSMATPAVNWNGTFRLPELDELLDFFMVMTYDYYWNLSSTAGPVAPLYPMENGYRYSVSRTIEYYLSQGIKPEKLLMGIPYYGRSWPVTRKEAPSPVRGSGAALTYRAVRGNNSIFNWQSQKYEPASRNTYYAYDAGGWNHVFTDDPLTLKMKYERVLASNLRGIGIWALGYDNGYPELWNLIGEYFTNGAGMRCQDTLFDQGGPYWLPPVFSDHTYSIETRLPGALTLRFHALTLNDVRLDVYDGTDTINPMHTFLPGEAGLDLPVPGNRAFLRFSETGSLPSASYAIVWRCPSAGLSKPQKNSPLKIVPNPFREAFDVLFDEPLQSDMVIVIRNLQGNILLQQVTAKGVSACKVSFGGPPGLYFLEARSGPLIRQARIIKL
jgi:hypothetical protein